MSYPAKRATVWISRGYQCIYRNLALEDWIFRHHSFLDQDGLLIWRNRPAVVFGRHQNPWRELDVGYARTRGVDVARRQSGGGAVYHDLGNMNICVFTSKQRHKRDDNLRLVAKVLKDVWDVNAEVTKRHDLMLDGKYKISGTAAKLTHDKAYHHFTLMLDVDVDRLVSCLTPSMPGIVSNATASTRSKVKTLISVKKDIEYETLLQGIVDEFCSRYEDSDVLEIDSITNANFDNVESVISEFSSWHWIYGMTPPFSAQMPYHYDNDHYTFTIHVDKGCVSRFSIDKSDKEDTRRVIRSDKEDEEDTDMGRSDLEDILNASQYIGCRFEPALCKTILDWLL